MHFTVGTDCSGMEAPIQALRNLSSVKFTHNFSCDIDRHVRETIRANFQPSGEIYSDITARSNKDLYVLAILENMGVFASVHSMFL